MMKSLNSKRLNYLFIVSLVCAVNVYAQDWPQYLGPDRNSYFPEMSGAQEVHEGPRLPDAAPDAQGDPVIENGLVVREIQKVLLTRHFELDLEGVLGDPYAHGREFVATFRHRVPHQDVSVQPMVLLPVFDDSR